MIRQRELPLAVTDQEREFMLVGWGRQARGPGTLTVESQVPTSASRAWGDLSCLSVFICQVERMVFTSEGEDRIV